MSFRVSRARRRRLSVCSFAGLACLLASFSLAFAQDAPTQPPAQTASPAAQPPARTKVAAAAPPEAPVAARYDNTYEVSAGFAYDHLHVSPPLPEGANLGGFNVIGTRWFGGRLGAAASVRGYYGTTGAAPNIFEVHGPFVDQYLFLAGPELRGPHNANLATSVHAFFGGAHGNFDSDLKGHTASSLGILPSQTAFASALGGSLDINRSPRIAYRLTPEVIITRYSGDASRSTQFNLGFTAGILYRFR